MPQKGKTPRNGGASWNSCGRRFQDSLTFLDLQAQFMIAAHHVRPELAAMIAAFTFGQNGHG